MRHDTVEPRHGSAVGDTILSNSGIICSLLIQSRQTEAVTQIASWARQAGALCFDFCSEMKGERG